MKKVFQLSGELKVSEKIAKKWSPLTSGSLELADLIHQPVEMQMTSVFTKLAI